MRTPRSHSQRGERSDTVTDEVDLLGAVRSGEVDSREHCCYGELRFPRIVRSSMTRKVEGQHRKAPIAEPGCQVSPPIQVLPNIVYKHCPMFAGTESQAA